MSTRISIDPRTRVGAVHLTVADLSRSIDYYRGAIGLAVLDTGAGRASLGAGERELVTLVEEQGALPARNATGLYHLALLVPERPDLAQWLVHAATERVALEGLSDHFVSEAVYLRDPDGHGIEIYCDRPRALWEGQVTRMTTVALDVRNLVATLGDRRGKDFAGLPPGTVMGHVHLQVASIPDTVGFYRDVLGLELMLGLGDSAAFFAAGGYHHHVGANTWHSRGAAPPGPGRAALRHATIMFPDTAERDRVAGRVEETGAPTSSGPEGVLVRDPSGVPLLLTV